MNITTSTGLPGFLLVRRYNKQVFEEGKPKKRIFTVADVNAIIEENRHLQKYSNAYPNYL